MMTKTKSNNETSIQIPMFSWWQLLNMFLFDIDYTKEKWRVSPDPETRALSIFVPKYSFWQMIKISLFDLQPKESDRVLAIGF